MTYPRCQDCDAETYELVEDDAVYLACRKCNRRSWLRDNRQTSFFDVPSPADLALQAPPPPTGPPAEVFTDEEGTPNAFREFCDTDDGRRFWTALEAAALEALHAGEKRFSTRSFEYEWRREKRGKLNNTFSAWFADALIVAHPELEPLIERRKRTKATPV